jgi:ABC-type transport system substrate-binding protein
VQIPVIANGDILSIEDAEEALRQSGADGVMIGRGAYGRPWLLGQVAAYLVNGDRIPDPSLAEQKRILLEHYALMLEHHGQEPGIRIARKHVAWYSKGLPGSAEFRVAVNHAITAEAVQALIDGFFRGTKFEATSVLTSTFQEFSDEGVPRYPYDPDRARALLREAGVSNFRFEITTVGLNPFDRFPVPLANDLQQVGIQATVRVLERGAYVQARSSGNLQSCITAVVGPPDPDSPLVTLYHTRSHPPGLNTSRYNRADALLAEAARAPDLAGRKAVYNRLLRQTMEDVPVIPLYADRLFIAHGPNVQGFVQNSLFTVNASPVSLRGA